eukprot:12343655-Alexandrium_andersonii.AAC.1
MISSPCHWRLQDCRPFTPTRQSATAKPSGLQSAPEDPRPAGTEALSNSRVRGEANRRTDK